MTSGSFLLVCCAYMLGLGSTGLIWSRWDTPIPLASYSLLLMGGIASAIIPRYWRTGPGRRQWIMAGIIAFLGAMYCLWHTPQPATDDVSRYASAFDQRSFHSVYGEVQSFPQVTRTGKGRFWLTATSLQEQSREGTGETGSEGDGGQVGTRDQPGRRVGSLTTYQRTRQVSGKVYVTAPLGQVTNLYPGQRVKVGGKLYEPSAASAPGEFDFRAYLASQDCFAGLSAKFIDAVAPQSQPQWGLWQLRQRIVKAQGRWLKNPEGPLVSAMTIGRQVVDLPYDIRDAFVEAGLAHTLAASGFQVSLVLGMVLAGLRSQSPRTQASVGAIGLLLFVELAGIQPSVMRAAVMGFAALIGIALERTVKPLGCLLVAVSLLLLWDPRWIWDIGFQLSVLATLGLMVASNRISQWLNWLPVAISTLISVPLAAYLWTVPLQLHYFGVIPPYSILLNVLSTPLVSVISLGGFASAIAALIWPLLGSLLAWPLILPSRWLIGLVDIFNQLPGHQWQVGNLPAWSVLVSYSCYAAVTIGLAQRQKS